RVQQFRVRRVGAPGRSRTRGPRLRRPDEADPANSRVSQPFATTRNEAGADSRASHVFVPFTEDSADRLRTLLTVRDVAAYHGSVERRVEREVLARWT